MMKHEFYYTSRDSVTKIHAIEWLPDREIKGVLQICHGMVEYIDRYDEFARYLAEKVDPFPTSLITEIVPPILSIIFFTIAMPSPVP